MSQVTSPSGNKTHVMYYSMSYKTCNKSEYLKMARSKTGPS